MKFLDLASFAFVFSCFSAVACVSSSDIDEGSAVEEPPSNGGAGGIAPDVTVQGGSSGSGGAVVLPATGGIGGIGGTAPVIGMGGSAGAFMDAGMPMMNNPDAGAPKGPTEGKVPALMAVGYGGLRVLSRDGGKTWTNRQILAPQGGDDQNLLRSAAWFDGLFVAVGWKVMTSEDGVTWIERKKTGLHDCVTFANGNFYLKNLRGGDAKVSKDRGVTWTDTPGGTVTCNSNFDSLTNGNVRLRTAWQGIIERSEGGSAFKKVYQDPQENHPNAFNTGWAVP